MVAALRRSSPRGVSVPEAPRGQIHLELLGICKAFEATQALGEVSLDIGRGRVHALVGENGAGKSTLGRIIAGVVTPDRGQLRINGQLVHLRSPRQALARGVVMISQELAIVPRRTVLANVFLGSEATRRGVLRRPEMRRRFETLTRTWNISLPAAALAGDLGTADQLKVELLRALARQAEIIIMDEPTASLGADDTSQLLAIVRRLRQSNTTVVFVSHFLEEVLSIADEVSVLRNGRLVRTASAGRETPDTLVSAMLGRSLAQTFPARPRLRQDGPVVCAVQHVNRAGRLHDISFQVRSGEILGIAGLVGSGRTRLARSIFGVEKYDSGEVLLDGVAQKGGSPRRAIEAGIAMVPENRKEQGLVMCRSVSENLVLAHLGAVTHAGIIDSRSRREKSRVLMEQLDVRPLAPQLPVAALSGGNQQKVLLAKWLVRRPRLLIVDEPTRGVDIGAKHGIYQLITSLASEGVAVVMISSEVEELLSLAHRIVVMRSGRIITTLDGETASKDDVLRAAFAQPVSGGTAP